MSKNKKLDAYVKQTEGLITRVVLFWNYIVFGSKAVSCMGFVFVFLNLFFKFCSHNCYFYITIQTIQIHIAATNYMSMLHSFFGIEKKELIWQKKILVGVKKDSIDRYVGKKHF